MQRRRNVNRHSLRWSDLMVLGACGLCACVIAVSIYSAMVRVNAHGRAEQRKNERVVALDEIGRHLDGLFLSTEAYSEPDSREWYGLNPPVLPPGPGVLSISHPAWNRIELPAAELSYRYGVYVGENVAWVLAYGDVDEDGRWSRIYRKYADGRLVREWGHQPEE